MYLLTFGQPFQRHINQYFQNNWIPAGKLYNLVVNKRTILGICYMQKTKKVWYFCPCKKVAIVSQWDKLASLKEMRKLELFIICFEIKKAFLQLSPYTSQEVQKGILFGFIGTEKVHYHCSFIPFLFINNLMIIELTWK